MTAQDETLLTIRAATMRFAATLALDRVDLDVRAGEIHALVGHNGSGKSTLVKILAGFHEPEPGTTITVRGTSLAFGSAAASRHAGLRFVHQDLGLVQSLSAVENLALGVGFPSGRLGRIRWRVARQAAQRTMHQLGYEFDVDRPVAELSAAERTGVGIARALEHTDDACLLVVDEPTATLPRHEVDILFEAIRRVTSRGVGVIYVSHRLDELFAIADSVTVLRDGRLVGTYPISELDEHRLVQLMMGAAAQDTERVRRSGVGCGQLLNVRGLVGSRLSGVTFGVGAGEVVGIGGLTGSGREELLPTLFGARTRRGGVVEVAGTQLAPGSPGEAIAEGVALVPADRHASGSVISLSVRENLVLTDARRHAGRLWRLRRSAERAEVQRWTNSLAIRPADPDAPLADLSGGNQQKVVLAKWLRMEPRVLLLDEPTQGVDVAAKTVIHQLARQAAAGGAAVLIASSDDAELCEYCDRVLVVHDGMIAGTLEGNEINSSAIAQLQLAAMP